jgi:hypothetical protein
MAPPLTELLARPDVTPQDATRAVVWVLAMARSEDLLNAACVAMPVLTLWPAMLAAFMSARAAAVFENCSYRIATKACSTYVAVTIDSAEDRAVGDVGCLEPPANGHGGSREPSLTAGVPGKFCTSGSETNWYGRSMEWASPGSTHLSRL